MKPDERMAAILALIQEHGSVQDALKALGMDAPQARREGALEREVLQIAHDAQELLMYTRFAMDAPEAVREVLRHGILMGVAYTHGLLTGRVVGEEES